MSDVHPTRRGNLAGKSESHGRAFHHNENGRRHGEGAKLILRNIARVSRASRASWDYLEISMDYTANQYYHETGDANCY